MSRRYTVVKIGGTVAEDETVTARLFEELRDYLGTVVLLHGGGKAVTRVSERYGITPVFEDGVRRTTPQEMEIVDMVLAGRVNTELVRLAVRCGVDAMGLTGADSAMLHGEFVGDGRSNRTATVTAVSLTAIMRVLASSALPIIAGVGIGSDGRGVNINADEAARAIADALAQAGDVTLCYLSDTPGVLAADSTVLPAIAANDVESLIADGVVAGGMAAKLRSSAAAVNTGVRRVIIGGYREAGDFGRLLTRENGTTVHAE